MASNPLWLRGYLKKGDHEGILHRSAEAEGKTGVEFVPVIVKRSSAVGHIEMNIALLLLFVLYLLRFYSPGRPDLGWMPWYEALLETGLAVIAAFLLARFHFIQRFFVPRKDRQQAVERRARLEFYKHHIEESPGGEGILLFVSLMERRCMVLCGRRLAQKLPPQAWHSANQQLAKGAKNGRLGEGIYLAIEDCERYLLKHGIRRRGKKTRVKEHFIVKE